MDLNQEETEDKNTKSTKPKKINLKNDIFFDKTLSFVPDPNYSPYGKNQISILYDYSYTSSNSRMLSDYGKQYYQKKSNKYWNYFYRNQRDKIFKDRHWMFTEFPDLVNSELGKKKVLNVGCGVGNGSIPVLLENKNLFSFACDFSSVAIDILNEKIVENNLKSRCVTFIHDITKPIKNNVIEDGSLDYVVCVFVMSAINPTFFETVFKNMLNKIKVNGKLFFCDFALNDERFFIYEKSKKKEKVITSFCIEKNFFMKGDKTFVYYFGVDKLKEIVEKVGGVKILDLSIKESSFENKKEKTKMNRKFIQLTLQKINEIS